jgi:hypothetical protein
MFKIAHYFLNFPSMFKRLIALSIIAIGIFILTHTTAAQTWGLDHTYRVASKTMLAFAVPDVNSGNKFTLYEGMQIDPNDVLVANGYKWFRIGKSGYWVPAVEPQGITHLTPNIDPSSAHIVDLYGIMDMPHRYAVKMVKYEGAQGRIETYEKVGNKYVMRHTYTLYYRKEGPKSVYYDLKSPGGPVIRYIYRTTRSRMNGWDKNRQHFGVYKVSYPMPHDALPHLLSGQISTEQYNKIPVINWQGEGENRMLYPHPSSYMGADIVLHTKRRGSRGCITIQNERMSYLYHHDLVTENDKELIPFVIYDENVIAPPIGQLF